MPKLSDSDAAKRQSHIEKAALRCFLKLGYHGTSVRDIAGAAKVSLGAVYTYFPDKLTLFSALLERLEAEFLSGDSALFAYLARSKFPDDIPALAEALATDTSRFRDYFKLIYIDVVEFDGKNIKEIFSRMEPKFRLLLGARFGDTGRLGARGRTDPGVAFVAVYLLFYEYFVLTRLFGAEEIFGKRSDADVTRELTELLLHGIASRSTTKQGSR